MKRENKYTALRTIGTIMKVLGVITAILTGITALGICGSFTLGGAALGELGREFGQGSSGMGFLGGAIGGLLAAILPVLLGGGLALALYAGGEMVYLQIDIEENTRTTARFLQHQGQGYAPAPVQQYPTPAPAPAELPQPYVAEPATMLAPEASSPVIYAYCPQCGTKLVEAAESCPACGYQLSDLQG